MSETTRTRIGGMVSRSLPRKKRGEGGGRAGALGRVPPRGPLVWLAGGPGSGETTLTQGIGRGWGALDSVTSPTFVIVNEYHRADAEVLVHVDAFRLGTAALGDGIVRL